MSTYSLEHILFIKKKKKEKLLVILVQIFILIFFFGLWELGARLELINTFLTSSPSKVFETFLNLFKANDLFSHIIVTFNETLISFLIATILGILVATLLWWNKFLAKVFDPYLTILNSLPKVALGPLIIIWVGANTNSIIFMALMISLIVTIINIYNGFIATDKGFLTLMESLKASKIQIYFKLIIPANITNIINSLKINISMSLIGVIMGELLVSKEGLGYLIMYGSQVFNINLVITSVVLLGILSYLMYYVIHLLEKNYQKR